MSSLDYNVENTAEDLMASFKENLDSGNFGGAGQVILGANSLEMFSLAKDMSNELEEVKANTCEVCSGTGFVEQQFELDDSITKKCPKCNY